jgi:hypothetical protein
LGCRREKRDYRLLPILYTSIAVIYRFLSRQKATPLNHDVQAQRIGLFESKAGLAPKPLCPPRRSRSQRDGLIQLLAHSKTGPNIASAAPDSYKASVSRELVGGACRSPMPQLCAALATWRGSRDGFPKPATPVRACTSLTRRFSSLLGCFPDPGLDSISQVSRKLEGT